MTKKSILSICFFLTMFMTGEYLVAEEIQTFHIGSSANCLYLLPNQNNNSILEVFYSPSWYDASNDQNASLPSLNTNHFFCYGSVNIHDKKWLDSPFRIIMTDTLTFCQPVGFYQQEHVVLICADIDGLTWRRNTPGINPIDQIFIKNIHLPTNTEYTPKSVESPQLDIEQFGNRVMRSGEKRPKSMYTISGIDTVSGMFDGTIGYYVGLSGSGSTKSYLWIFSFSAPEFDLQETYPQRIHGNTEEPLVSSYTHIASSFLNSIPLIAYRNGQDGSIHVIDYDPEKQLCQSPLREVRVPEEYRGGPIENLLMTSGVNTAYLGVVFIGKNEEKAKRFLLFERTNGTTEWKEFARLDLPKNSFSPTMCVQNGDLFYAYLQQPVVAGNPQENTGKVRETSLNKKITVFKYSTKAKSIATNEDARETSSEHVDVESSKSLTEASEERVQEKIRAITPVSEEIPVIIKTIRYDSAGDKPTVSQTVTKGIRREYRYDLEPNPKSRLANSHYNKWFLSIGLNDSDPKKEQYGIWFSEYPGGIPDDNFSLYIFGTNEQYLLWKIGVGICMQNICEPIDKGVILEKTINADSWSRPYYVMDFYLDMTDLLLEETGKNAKNVRIVSFSKTPDGGFCLTLESPKSKSLFVFVVAKEETERALTTYNSTHAVKLTTPPPGMVQWKLKEFKTSAEVKMPKQFRNWFASGEHIVAKYVSNDDKNVVLEKEDGTKTTIALANLRWDGGSIDYINLVRKAENLPGEPITDSYLRKLENEMELEESKKPVAKPLTLEPQMREWQSTDGLFKTTAKFVALEKDEVTLERVDGKQTSIELDVLRKEDQEYVRYYLVCAEAKQPPVLRTWRSSDGEHEIKATFVSGDTKTIYLKREDGTTIEVEVASLSAEDQEYVQLRLEAQKEATP